MSAMTIDVPENVHIAPSIQRDDEWLKPIVKASNLLPRVIGPGYRSVKAEWWSPKGDQRIGTVVLELSDGVSSHQIEFALDDFRNENHVYRRLYSLWGAVLKDLSHRLLTAAQESLRTAINTPLAEEVEDDRP